MILSNKNDLLYDSKNFNKYRNIYAVLVNYGKIEYIQTGLENCNDDLHQEYISYNFELKLFFLAEQYMNIKGVYKIVFGHYYNNQNQFLYKNLYNKEVVTPTIHRCKYNELLYNNVKDLVYSNSYEALKKQTDVIIKIRETRIKQKYFPIAVSYDNNTLNIETNGKLSTSFSDGCLHINNINI